MEAFDNIDCQTIERFHNNYIQTNGDEKYRFAVLGGWTVDVKKQIKMLTKDKDNTNYHRLVVRGTVHARQRPQNMSGNSRFGGGSIIAP